MADRLRFDENAMSDLFDSPAGPVGKELKRIAMRVTRSAKRRCPVDTGRLRASIVDELGADDRGLVATIGTDVEYAGFVEFGTSRARAQPFLIPALHEEVGP